MGEAILATNRHFILSLVKKLILQTQNGFESRIVDVAQIHEIPSPTIIEGNVRHASDIRRSKRSTLQCSQCQTDRCARLLLCFWHFTYPCTHYRNPCSWSCYCL